MYLKKLRSTQLFRNFFKNILLRNINRTKHRKTQQRNFLWTEAESDMGNKRAKKIWMKKYSDTVGASGGLASSI
jgi:hypothetical protein